MTERKTEDYGRTLRRRLWHAVGLTALGLVGMIVSVMLLPGGLPSPARAFYRGGSWGILLCGVVNLIRTCWLLGRPERWKENRVRETDERQQHIDRAAAHFAGAAVMYLQFAAALVLAAVDWRVGLLMSGLNLAYFALFLLARWRLSKKK